MKTHTPAHTHSIPLRGLQFPYTFELTANNLLFPLTKEAWGKDNRAFDDLGISALLDLDGKFSSANENDLLGFGISKPVAIAGSQVRVMGRERIRMMLGVISWIRVVVDSRLALSSTPSTNLHDRSVAMP